MSLKIRYNDKEVFSMLPSCFAEFINCFKNTFAIDVKILKGINFYYIDEDCEETILSNEEDYEIFKQIKEKNDKINTIYAKRNENYETKEYNDQLLNLKSTIDSIKLKHQEEINKIDNEYNQKIQKEFEQKDNILSKEILKKG